MTSLPTKPRAYAPRSEAEVVDVVADYPMAWIVSSSPGGATLAPVQAELDEDGRLRSLIGHMARANPQVDWLRQDVRAMVLVTGPQAYVSPSWMTDRTQAPTWNYVGLAFDCEIDLIEESGAIGGILDNLVAAMEKGRPDPWSLTEMGERYDRLARGVIGFRARILDRQVAFKAGQDEREDVWPEVVSGLEVHAPAMAEVMKRYKPG